MLPFPLSSTPTPSATPSTPSSSSGVVCVVAGWLTSPHTLPSAPPTINTHAKGLIPFLFLFLELKQRIQQDPHASNSPPFRVAHFIWEWWWILDKLPSILLPLHPLTIPSSARTPRAFGIPRKALLLLRDEEIELLKQRANQTSKLSNNSKERSLLIG